MGTYLSTPVTEKCLEAGESIEDYTTYNPTGSDIKTDDTASTTTTTSTSNRLVRWGVVDMQGWRKGMEDAHIATSNIPVPIVDSDSNTQQATATAKVFAVFDGHGGPEVARFCSLYLISVLQQQETWKVLQKSQQLPQQEGDNDDKNKNNASNTESSNDSGIGQALVSAFHSLDRMIDDPKRRDEICRLRLMKPKPGEKRTVDFIPPPRPQLDEVSVSETTITTAATTVASEVEHPTTSDEAPASDNSVNTIESESETEKKRDDGENNPESTNPVDQTNPTIEAASDSDAGNAIASTTRNDSGDIATTADISLEGTKSDDDDDDDDDAFEDADSQEATGLEEAAVERANAAGNSLRDDDDENDDNDEFVDSVDLVVTENETEGVAESDNPSNNDGDDQTHQRSINLQQQQQQINTTAGKVSIMFQRLLNMSGQSGQVVLSQMGNSMVVTTDLSGAAKAISAGSEAVPASPTNAGTDGQSPVASPAASLSTSSMQPSIVRNGNIFCNLQDHPIHAGATAIVAVLVGRTLTVANAGDSRAVLYRGGSEPRVIPLSFDHKPMQERELSRIRAAGGFVNSFGRVNGNLNLSRSIGDLKYKQVAGIPPERQIITAEPDIKQIQLVDDDEFLILGCDGIWDCLSNEKAVEYVLERINEKSLTDIGIEMLDTIISNNPQSTQGIGGDNMTILIVDLQPQKRTKVVFTPQPQLADSTSATTNNNQ